MKAPDLLARLENVTEHGDSYLASCPAHADQSPSLLVTFTRSRVLLHCRAGCAYGDVRKALSMSETDGFDPTGLDEIATSAGAVSPASPLSRLRLASTAYRLAVALAERLTEEPDGAEARLLSGRFGIGPLDVTGADEMGLGWDEHSARVTVTARTTDQAVAFLQGRSVDPAEPLRWRGVSNPDGERYDAAGWIGPRKGERPVVIVEGPSDALTVAALGAYDVVAVRGASQGRRVIEVAEGLSDRDVIIVADADAAGRKFARTVADAVAMITKSVKVATLPDGLDVNDYRASEPATFAARLAGVIAAASNDQRAPKGLDIRELAKPHRAGTDADRAEALLSFARAYGYDLAYTDAAGWLVYDGHIWIQNAEARVRLLCHRLGAAAREEAAEIVRESGIGEVTKQLDKFATKFRQTSTINYAMRELAASVKADYAEWDANPDLLAVANGVVDLRTGTLRPSRREDKLIRQLPTEYDPDAASPRWDRFLREVLVDQDMQPDEDLIGWMQSLIGYGITGWTTEQCFAVLQGGGSNGKSKFLDALAHVFGSYAVTAPFSTFEERGKGTGIPNDIAMLKGSRLAIASEGRANVRMDEALLKSLTGSDRITARFLNKEFFSFTPAFLLLLATNNEPQFVGQDEGLWRRVKMIYFRRYFAPHEWDRDLGETLRTEAAGILAWAVRGAVAWYGRGKRLTESLSVKEATATFRVSSDPLREFLVCNLEDTGNQRSDQVLCGKLFERYRNWTLERGEPMIRKGPTLMKREFVTRLGEARRSNRRPESYRGYRLRSEAEAETLWREGVGDDPKHSGRFRIVGSAA